MTASLLGLETGCCSCVMNYDSLKEILQTESDPVLLMGVGYKNEGVNRRNHPLACTDQHKEKNWQEVFRSFKKEPIGTYLIK